MLRIILFDGDCNLCNDSVQFIIKRDPNGKFKFCSLQSDLGKGLIEKHKLPGHTDSFILIENEQCFMKSSGALQVCKHLQGLWRFMVILKVIPVPIRDFFYEIIAKNRYKWFGKRESCMLPSPGVRDRFLD